MHRLFLPLSAAASQVVSCIGPAENVVHRRSFTPAKTLGAARSLAAGDDF
jgi:hypothetical protein